MKQPAITRTPHRPARPVALAALAVLTALAGTACADDAGGDDEAGPVLTAEDNGASPVADRRQDDGEVIATTSGQHPASPLEGTLVPLRLDVTALARDGDLVRLEATLVNESDPESAPYEPYSTMSDRSLPVNWDLSGASLVDGEGQKAYLAVLDSDQRCLCTNLANMQIAGGASLDVYATFGGVPDDLESVDVAVPGFAPIVNLAIEGD